MTGTLKLYQMPSYISLGLTLGLYLLASLCLVANSRTWVNSLNSSITSAAHSNMALFASSLNWDHRHEGMSIFTSNIVSAPYTMENGVSLVVEHRVVWYNHNISWSNVAHRLLASSSFFLSAFRITLLADSTCPLVRGCIIDTYFVCTPKSL